MTTVSAEQIFKGMKALIDGGDAADGADELPAANEFPRYRVALKLELKQLWRSEWWPDLMLHEWRYFRQNWSSATTYNKTNEVYDAATQQYFQCLRDSVSGSGQSPTDSAGDERSDYWALCETSYGGANWASGTAYAVGDKVFYPVTMEYYQCHTAHTSSATLVPDATGGNERWGILTPFDRYIAKEQSWETNDIGDCADVKNANPKVTNRWRSLEWDNSENGIQVMDARAGVTVFVQFRKPCPQLKGEPYSATATYAVDDQIYFDSGVEGNFYNCISATSAGQTPLTHAAKWSVVQIPEYFEEALIQNAAKRVRLCDEEMELAGVHGALGEMAAQTEPDVMYRQQGRTPALPMVTYPGG